MRIPFAIICPLVLTACVPYRAATAPDEPHFEHLRQGDVAAFDQRIKADVQSGAETDETAIGLAWLDFLSCEPIKGYELSEPGATWAVELLRVEEARRATYVISRRSEPARLVDLPYGRMAADEPLRWEPRASDGAGGRDEAIIWPAEDEDWADELTAATEVERSCPGLLDRLLGRDDSTEEDGQEDATNRPTSLELVWPHYVRQFDALERANRAFDQLESPSNDARRVDLESRIYAYLVVDRFGRLAANRDDFVVPETFTTQTFEALDRGTSSAQADAEKEGSPLGQTVATARYLLAVHAFEHDDLEASQKHLALARKASPPELLDWPIRHLEQWMMWREGDWAAIAETSDELPPTNHPDFGSYVYRRATALLRSGEPDRFLATITEAMADRSWSNDPYLEATWGAVLRFLADVPFDPRVAEVIENLGPRSGTYERMEELGRTALDLGRPAVADDVATWLLARDRDARRHPRYHALRALADFLRDDRAGFTEDLRKITRRDPELLEALPASRQARFFEHADRELARIIAQTLPMMAEWGDDEGSRESRRAWLTLMVEEIQRFLRTAEETSARSQLVELYRLAGRLLADHPRGYAERVGRDDSDDLILGTVQVEPGELESKAFLAKSLIPISDFVAPIPRDAPVNEWDGRWPFIDLGREEDK